MNCRQCNNECVRHIAWTPPGSREPFIFCGKDCKAGFRANYDPPKPAAIASNAKKGVKIQRPKKKPSPSQIRRSLRPTERDVSKSIGKQLTDSGFWNTRTQSGQIRTAAGHTLMLCRSGTPDRIAAVGVHVWIEVKRPGEQASAEQSATIATLKENGALAFVLDDPADLDFILQGIADAGPNVAVINRILRTMQDDINAAIATNRQARHGNDN